MTRCLMAVRFKNFGIDIKRHWEADKFETFALRTMY